jgi:hypothetical protein
MAPMDDSEKPGGGSLPAMSISDQRFQPNDLLVLQHFLSETEPLTTLCTSDVIDPVSLHFLPEHGWSRQMVSLQSLHDDYFRRKNNVNRRFEYKLWNALRLMTVFPNMTKFVGVVWVTESVIKVCKQAFAMLLNIAAIDGCLFHKQGNFTRHGFVTLTDEEARERVQTQHLIDVDFRDVLLITHERALFTSLAGEASVGSCRWDNPDGAIRIATLRMDPLYNQGQ